MKSSDRQELDDTCSGLSEAQGGQRWSLMVFDYWLEGHGGRDLPVI